MSYFIAIDTETSGLIPGESELLSLAAVSSRPESGAFHVHILPTTEVPAEAAAVNGYTPELWAEKGALPLKHALLAFLAWLDREQKESPAPLRPLAHNAAFDRAMLEAAERSTGLRTGLTHRWRCSMVAMLHLQDAGILPPGYVNLDTLGILSGFWKKEARTAAHYALQDARCCLHGYQWLLTLSQPTA